MRVALTSIMDRKPKTAHRSRFVGSRLDEIWGARIKTLTFENFLKVQKHIAKAAPGLRGDLSDRWGPKAGALATGGRV